MSIEQINFEKQTSGISLDELEGCLPAEWLKYRPSAIESYIDVARRSVADCGIETGRAFDGFKGVPRYFHPRADQEGLQASLLLIAWYFYFDDPFDSAAEVTALPVLTERMIATLQGVQHADMTPAEKLCWKYRNHTRSMAGEERVDVWARFISECVDWVKSIRGINRRFRDGETPSLQEYQQLRLINVGILPEYTLNEIIEGFTVPETFRNMAAVKRYGELAALIIAYFNDVFSYEREAHEATQFNSLELRKQRGNLSLAEAYADQLQDIRLMLEEMVRIEQHLTRLRYIGFGTSDEAGEDLRARRAQSRHIEGIRNIVIGNHLWSIADGRYHSASSPFIELRVRRPDRRRQASALQAS